MEMERLTKRCDNLIVMKSSLGYYVESFDTSAYDIRLLLEKLAEYEDLEEQGKLLKLPCAVGDTVYSFSFEKILTFHVDGFVIYRDGVDIRIVCDMEDYKFLKADFDISNLGKKWFLKREEAEAVIRKQGR